MWQQDLKRALSIWEDRNQACMWESSKLDVVVTQKKNVGGKKRWKVARHWYFAEGGFR